MTYEMKGTKKQRRASAFKDWRRYISVKEKWQAKVLRNKIKESVEVFPI